MRQLALAPWALVLLIPCVAPLGAEAQQEPACFPPCRSGYLCVDGACVSACNPPCSGGDRCVDGACVPAGAPSTTPPPQGPGPAPTPPPGGTTTFAPPPGAANASPARGQGWVTAGATAPQPPGDSRREELRSIRKLVQLVGYVAPSIHAVGTRANNGVELVEGDFDVYGDGYSATYSDSFTAFGIGAAFGIRFNFAYLVGMQTRLYFDLIPGVSGQIIIDDDVVESCGVGGVDCQADGIAFRFGLDATFRIGPFAQAFPMYVGVGGYVGARQISASSNLADYNTFSEEYGGVAELGFVFGPRENFDLGVRIQGGPETYVSGLLSFGFSLASL